MTKTQQGAAVVAGLKKTKREIDSNTDIDEVISSNPGSHNDMLSIKHSQEAPQEQPPPTKRQKQDPNSTPQLEGNSIILEFLSDVSLTAHVFSFLGPYGTSQCAATCTAWYAVSKSCPSLWKQFLQDDFGLSVDAIVNSNNAQTQQQQQQHEQTEEDHLQAQTTKANKESKEKELEQLVGRSNGNGSYRPATVAQLIGGNHNNNQLDTSNAPLKQQPQVHHSASPQVIYQELALAHQQQQQQQRHPQGNNNSPGNNLDQSRLEATVVFADDGGNFPGYPPSNALRREKSMVWCTRTGVDKNVDLVVRLNQPSLITGFVAANGGRGYSAPLQEGLVFVSMDPPNLEAARFYNIDDTANNDTANNSSDTDSNSNNPTNVGREWVQYLHQTKTTTAQPPRQRQRTLTEFFQQRDNNQQQQQQNNEDGDNVGDNENENDDHDVEENDNDNNNVEVNADANAAEAAEQEEPAREEVQPAPQQQQQQQQQQEDDAAQGQPPSHTTTSPPAQPTRPPSASHTACPDPVASFWFPQLQHAYHGRSFQPLSKPMVGRYIHMKLLTSHSPPGLEQISDNIDLMHFHTLGVEVPQLQEMLALPDPPVPEYPRRYEKRQSRDHNARFIHNEEDVGEDEVDDEEDLPINPMWFNLDF